MDVVGGNESFTWTGQSDVLPLSRVVLKHAREALQSQTVIDREWSALGYAGRPIYERGIEEYERFVELLRGLGCELLFLPWEEGTTIDSIYVRDATLFTNQGIVLCRMGKAARASEPLAQAVALANWDVPVLGGIEGEGRLEGGDVAWLDPRTVAVGRGYRTNDAGIEQLRTLLGDSIDEMIVVPLPHWRGPADVFHLMSFFSPLDDDLALVYEPLLPVPFREELMARGYALIGVPDNEFDSMGCNVLAVAPRTCLALAGNIETRRRLERADVQVIEFEGAHISGMGLGGPTCLTRPLERRLGRPRSS